MSEMGNQQVTEAEIGWLAGIIDGEGCLLLLKQQTKHGGLTVTPYVSISNTDMKIILATEDILRRLDVKPYRQQHMTSGNKICFAVCVKSLAKVIRLLSPVVYHMTGKRKERAELLLKFCYSRKQNAWKEYSPEELAMVEKANQLSKAGTSEATREAQRHNSEVWAMMEKRKEKRDVS